MLLPMSPTSSLFLLAETRENPMHVGSLQLYRPPEGADALDVRALFERAIADNDNVNPLFLKRARRSVTSLGQWGWEKDPDFDLDYHVRRSALPQPGRILDLLALCSRLHSTLLDRHRPLWEMHLIEGLEDGRYAIYFKVHHSVVDGVAALRVLARSMTEDVTARDMPAPWAPPPSRPKHKPSSGNGVDVRRALTDVIGLGPALGRTMTRALTDQSGAVSLAAPRSMFNVGITSARRFAAQSWPIDRIRAVTEGTGTTINDVVLAMCSGALRRYMQDLDALPASSLIAMVPVSLREAGGPEEAGGNAVGVIMCRLGTDRYEAAERLATVHESMEDGKAALRSMTPTQILAMSALAVSPLGLWPALRLTEAVRPPFNLVISNVPGPRNTLFWNGARLDGLFPLSIPLDGQALNITCLTYDDEISFGLVGCRRTVPHLQRMLAYLDDELAALEKSALASA